MTSDRGTQPTFGVSAQRELGINYLDLIALPASDLPVPSVDQTQPEASRQGKNTLKLSSLSEH